MSKKIRALIVYGGSLSSKRDRTLKKHARRLGTALTKGGAGVKRVNLEDYPFKVKNADPSKKILRGLKPLHDGVVAADIVVLVTSVHWRLPTHPMVAFIHHVLAPMEWGGLKGGGYECWGKIGATLVVCDDDGASQVASMLHDTLTHMGFFFPPWAAHHKNVAMQGGEDDWQNKPESLAPILIETAKRMRSFPSPQQLLKK